MDIHSFLFNFIELLVTLSIGVLTLALAFSDKFKLDFSNKKTKLYLSLLWFCFILSLILYLAGGLLIFTDAEYSAVTDEPQIRWQTKTCIFATLLIFILMLVALTLIGATVIREKSKTR
jgi:hypothetical protein